MLKNLNFQKNVAEWFDDFYHKFDNRSKYSTVFSLRKNLVISKDCDFLLVKNRETAVSSESLKKMFKYVEDDCVQYDIGKLKLLFNTIKKINEYKVTNSQVNSFFKFQVVFYFNAKPDIHEDNGF